MAKQLLVYLEGNRAILYGNTLPAMQQIDFPADVVKDLDVLNTENLYALIQTTIETYQLLPAPVTIVLSPLVTFEKDLSEIPLEQREKEAEKFLDQVPFQNVLPYQFISSQKAKIIAANKDFILAIKTGFEKRTFMVNTVASFSTLQEVMPELAENLDLNLLLVKIDTIKQYNMLHEHMPPIHSSPIQTEPGKEKPDKKRLYMLIGVFGILILILIIVAVTNLAPAKPQVQQLPPRPTSQSTNEPTTQSITDQTNNPATQSVEGISTYRKITPIFYRITRGGH
jgi:hypothetical protein